MNVTYQFTGEIQRMMFSFGDCMNPSEESANLIESIVLEYLVKVMHQLEEVCIMRESKMIGIEEMLFLFRKDKIKLIRLIHFLKFKDMKDSFLKEFDAESDAIGDAEKFKPKKRLKICHDFFSQIDPNGSLLSLLESDVEDELKKQRRIRLEKLTRQLTTQQYLVYCKAREANFAGNKEKMQKFNDWLFSRLSDFEVKVSQHLSEVLCYLAYEAVAELVESALLVRRDGEVKKEDPLTLYSSASSVNYEQSSLLMSKSEPFSNNVDQCQMSSKGVKHDPCLTFQHALMSSEIREAVRRLSQCTSLFSYNIKSVPSCVGRQLWL